MDCSKIKQEVDVENQEHFGLAEDWRVKEQRDISQKLTAMDAAEWRRIHEDDVHVKLVFVWDYHGVSSSKGTLVGVWLFMLV